METNRIRQYCAIAETLNLRQAAELLNITHSGLYKSLKVLEDELGFFLFRKEGRGIVLTEEGTRFYPRALKFLSAFEELIEKPTFKLDDIRIGTFEVFSTHFFAKVLFAEIQDKNIELKELIPGQMEKALLADEIDVGITYEPVPSQGLKTSLITQIEMGLFGKKGTFKDMPFSEIPFAAPLIPIRSTISGVKGLDGWPEDKIKRNKKYNFEMLETAMQICADGNAIGFFPKFIVNLFNKDHLSNKQLLEFPNPKKLKTVKRNVYLVQRNSAEESLIIKKIAKSLRKGCKLSATKI